MFQQQLGNQLITIGILLAHCPLPSAGIPLESVKLSHIFLLVRNGMFIFGVTISPCAQIIKLLSHFFLQDPKAAAPFAFLGGVPNSCTTTSMCGIVRVPIMSLQTPCRISLFSYCLLKSVMKKSFPWLLLELPKLSFRLPLLLI